MWMVVANLSLVAGIVLPYAFHPASGLGKDWLEALRGLFIGVSIGVNLLVLRFARRGTSPIAAKP
ncbi:MAG: hypothetical protein WCC26_19950 [Terracidiphilus sp.]